MSISRNARPLIIVIVVVAAAALMGLLLFGLAAQRPDATIEQALAEGRRPAAPGSDLRLPLLDSSGTTSLADLVGEVVVLNFWASWCRPCEEEAPALEGVHRELVRTKTGRVLGVTYQDTAEDSRRFVTRLGITYHSARDIGVELADEFGTRGLPETFVLDSRGRIVSLSRGQVDVTFLREAIRRATAPSG